MLSVPAVQRDYIAAMQLISFALIGGYTAARRMLDSCNNSCLTLISMNRGHDANAIMNLKAGHFQPNPLLPNAI